MKRFATLIGLPLSHSVSPSMQQAAFDYYGIDAEYQLWEVREEGLEASLQRLRMPECMGANITIPYKSAAIPFLDEISDDSAKIGAVNTIVNRGGKLAGFNTDSPGFLRALEEDGDFDVRGKRVVVLGAGGAARAVIFAIAGRKPESITVAARNIDKARNACLVASNRGFRCDPIRCDCLRDSGVLDRCDLIVNATPVGLKAGESPLAAEYIRRPALVYDLIYRPTALLEYAAAAGARTLGGLPMLVYQGALSFSLWTGKPAPEHQMFAAARKALEQGA
ncbi:MAG: shikimate dehydrogenase [Chloroflexi bacterium]|nr:shikimate dehydrogenase [Chloroflexota bacterium]